MYQPHPPKWALRFLRWFCKDEYLDEIEGDLYELFHARAAASKSRANAFFVWNVLKALHPVNLKSIHVNTTTMHLLSNYVRIYFRRFRKEAIHYLVNILGLALGFAILFFILLFVYDEQHIDTFHSKADRIYRVIEKSTRDDGQHSYYSTPGPLAEALELEFPAIEAVAHLSCTGSHLITKGENKVMDRKWGFVTKELFDIWDIHMVDGNPRKDFSGQAGLVLTEQAAQSLFGRTDVVGERVDESRFGPIEVLAIMEPLPRNSSHQFNELYVVNYDQWQEDWKRYATGWDHRFTSTWVLLKEGQHPASIYERKEAFLDKYYNDESRVHHDFYLQPITDLHLGSTAIERGGMGPRVTIPDSSRTFVTVILLMGMLVLTIAALNYINLSSVQALKRTLEASMRQINGATTRQLLGQLFLETFLTVVLAYALSLVLLMVFFPYFQQVTNKDFTLGLLVSGDFVGYQVVAVLIVTVVAAILPAIYYSRLKRSLLVLKNAFSGKGEGLRKVLVGIQYALSIFLMVGTLVIYQQLDFVRSKDLGFDQSHVLTLDINSSALRSRFKSVVQELKKHANIQQASASSRVPGEWKNLPAISVGVNQTDDPVRAYHYGVDRYWLDTYDIKLLEGNHFTGVDATDSLGVLVNQQMVKTLALEDPVGQALWLDGDEGKVKMKIIGVVEDFHYQSLYESIAPVILTSWNNHIIQLDYFSIRFTSDLKETAAYVEAVNDAFDPETPAEINILDDQWNRFYEAEQSRATITMIAAVVSIIISAFGLFGLINFTVERRTKEFGIRKVLGASIRHLTTLVLRDYAVLLLVSLLIAAPVSWWLLGGWLETFAYRIHLGVDVYLAAFLLVVAISLSTVLYRVYQMAKSTPVDSIKYE